MSAERGYRDGKRVGTPEQVGIALARELVEAATAFAQREDRVPSQEEMVELLRPLRARAQEGMSEAEENVLGCAFAEAFHRLVHEMKDVKEGGPDVR